jgi:hypothetical protein
LDFFSLQATAVDRCDIYNFHLNLFACKYVHFLSFMILKTKLLPKLKQKFLNCSIYYLFPLLVYVTNLCKFSDVTIIRISSKNLPQFKMKISMTCFQLISNEQCLIINMGIPGKLFDKKLYFSDSLKVR